MTAEDIKELIEREFPFLKCTNRYEHGVIQGYAWWYGRKSHTNRIARALNERTYTEFKAAQSDEIYKLPHHGDSSEQVRKIIKFEIASFQAGI